MPHNNEAGAQRDELYHLAVDPGETRNLIGESDPRIKEVVGNLHRRILERMRELQDPVLELLEQEQPGMLR